LDENRYFELPTEFHDVIIIGSGIAGVYTALEKISNSVLAQGGIAVFSGVAF